MSSGDAASGFWNGVNLEERQQGRRDVKQRDEREAKLQTLVNSGLPPAQVQQGIRDIYGQDAPALQRHVENLFRRVAGKQPQEAQAPKRAADLAGLEAQGTTPEQRQESRFKTDTDYQNQQGLQYDQQAAQQKQQRDFALIDQYVTDPEQNKAMKQAYVQRVAEGTTRVSADQQKRGDYQALIASGQVPKDGQGNPLSYEAWVASQAASGRAAGTPEKPGTPRVGTSGGKNVYAVLTPKGWVDAGTKQPLNDFRPLPTYAQVAPSMRAIEVVDNPQQGTTKIESVPQAIKDHAEGTKSADFKLSIPTAQERGRSDLASSAREQLGDMVSILQKREDLFGPVAGRETNFTQWIGSQDPDAQAFASAARIASDHLAGVFGGRSQAALQAIYETIGKNTTNPAAAIAAIKQMDKAAQNIEAKGKGKGPAPGGGGQTKGTKSLKAAMALPINKGKTAEQVTQDLQAHGYKVGQ